MQKTLLNFIVDSVNLHVMNKEDLLDLVSKGLSTRSIASETGKSTTTVRYWLRKYEIKTDKKKNYEISYCKQCGSDFKAYYREVNRGNGKFCSRACLGKYRSENKKVKESNVQCAACGHKFHKTPSRFNRTKSGLHFCSTICHTSSQRIGGIKEVIPLHYGTSYRSICAQHHEMKCVVCDEDKIVAVHHHDCNHENNDPKNLVPLCPTHHQYVHSSYAPLVSEQIEAYLLSRWGSEVIDNHPCDYDKSNER